MDGNGEKPDIGNWETTKVGQTKEEEETSGSSH